MLSKEECDKLHQLLIRVAKWKAELTSTISNSVPLQNDIWKINFLWQQHTEHMFTEWIIRINNPNLVGELTRIRLKDVQLLLHSIVLVWILEKEEIQKQKWKNNLNVAILAAAKDLGLNIKNIDIEKNWNIALDNNLVNEIKVLLKKEDLEKGMQSL